MMRQVRSDLRYYLNAHRNRHNLTLHYFAFMAALGGWVFLWIDWRLTLLLAVLHYSLSWIGHFCFEKNRPAAFRYPWVGFYAGFIWFFVTTFEILTRKKLLRPWLDEKA